MAPRAPNRLTAVAARNFLKGEHSRVQSTRTDSIPGTASTASTGGLTGTRPQGAKITGMSHLDDHSGPGPEVMSANSLEGNKVINPRGETLGEIEEIMLDVRSGCISH